MKSQINIRCKLALKMARKHAFQFFLIPLFTLTLVCCTGEMSEQYIGKWQSGKSKITVRFKTDGSRHSEYISDSAVVILEVHDKNTVSGSIGLASFKNGKIKWNFSLPWEDGIKYIIKCGPVGKIFESDPEVLKEVDIWIGPVNESGKIKAELRKGGIDYFPMAHLMFERVKD